MTNWPTPDSPPGSVGQIGPSFIFRFLRHDRFGGAFFLASVESRLLRFPSGLCGVGDVYRKAVVRHFEFFSGDRDRT